MLGVLINVITVILGSSAGLLFKKGIPERVSSAAMVGLGACTLYIGISGSLQGENVLILIASVVLGGISGTLLNIDGGIAGLAEKAESRFRKTGSDISVAEGIISATLLFCVGSGRTAAVSTQRVRLSLCVDLYIRTLYISHCRRLP